MTDTASVGIWRMLKLLSLKFTILMFMLFPLPDAKASCIGINCTCSVSSSTTVSFGSYNPVSGAALNGTGSFSVTCSALIAGLNVSYVMALNAGQYGTFAARQMNNAGSLLSYNLYTTSALTTVWGDGTAGTSTKSDSYILSLLSNTITYTVYGSIPGSQNVPTGTYTDTITVTVTY